MPIPERISIESLFGFNSREGLVQITMGDQVAQLSVAEAINHARRILEAANAAATDMAVARFLTERLNQPLEVVGAILGDLRAWRLEHEPE